jgi:hypothetical protein
VQGVTIDSAFDSYQKFVNADPAQVRLARERRDVFKRAFRGENDVAEVFGSGSLARSTQLKPVHDVDLIVVYDHAEHPRWGQAGDSAADSLQRAQAQVMALLGISNGTVAQLVRETRAAGRNRSVKCFIDPPDADDAFTVDVMPALRLGSGHLVLPAARDGRWDEADPEYLTGEVAARQRQWPYFREIVRVLKDWRLDQGLEVKSLVMEVLALECLTGTGSRPVALRDFFTAAAVEVMYGVEDPAKLCGSIQPDLDAAGLSAALGRARDAASLACVAADAGDVDTAKNFWRQVFGEDFPAPGKSAAPAAVPVAPVRPVKDAPQG